jgi:hypothetical protein
MGERRGVYRVLVGKPERKRQVGRVQYYGGSSGIGMWWYGLDQGGS